MTSLEDYVWSRLSFRKRLVGRVVVNRIIRSAVWHKDSGDAEGRIRQEEAGMGILLTFFVGAIISEIVKIVAEWWRENRK
jgi:hypothetical protein